MKTFQLAGQVRSDLGKKATKAVRNAASIPCVIYGGESTTHFLVEAESVRKLIYSPDIFLIELTVDGKKCNAIIQALQFHPVSDRLLHIDFLQVFEDKEIKMDVPVKLEGLAQGVREGGKLSLEMRKLKVKGYYKNIPELLTVNVNELGLGKTIQVGECSFPNLELLNASNAVVCAVKLTRAARGARAAAASKGK